MLAKNENITITIYLLDILNHNHILTSSSNDDLLEEYHRAFDRINAVIEIKPFYNSTDSEHEHAFNQDDKATVFLKTSSISFWTVNQLTIRNIIFNAMELIPSTTQCPHGESNAYCLDHSTFKCQDNINSFPTPSNVITSSSSLSNLLSERK